MLHSHTCGQLVGPADQHAGAGRLRAPLHRVGVELRVKHVQRSRTGASIHDRSAPARSLGNTNVVLRSIVRRKHVSEHGA